MPAAVVPGGVRGLEVARGGEAGETERGERRPQGFGFGAGQRGALEPVAPGLDDRGQRMPAGMFFLRLGVEGYEVSRKLLMLH